MLQGLRTENYDKDETIISFYKKTWTKRRLFKKKRFQHEWQECKHEHVHEDTKVFIEGHVRKCDHCSRELVTFSSGSELNIFGQTVLMSFIDDSMSGHLVPLIQTANSLLSINPQTSVQIPTHFTAQVCAPTMHDYKLLGGSNIQTLFHAHVRKEKNNEQRELSMIQSPISICLNCGHINHFDNFG
ncbi:hypothetical protein AKO1_004480, partial [Acrasis kona]